MKRKKITALLMATALAAGTLLSGCGESADDKGKADNTVNDEADDKKDEEKKDDEEKADDGEVKVIKFGTGDDSLITREMAEKYSELHPDVKIEFVTCGYTGNEKLAELAATGELPDIINLESWTLALQNDWLYDMNEFAKDDPEMEKLPDTFRENCQLDGKLYMLPGQAWFMGLEVNTDLLEANGIPVPGYDWTFDEFVDIVKQATKKGVSIGTNSVLQYLEYIPAQMNENLAWGGFNPTTREYEVGPETEYAVSVIKEILDANASLNEPIDALGNPWNYEEGSTERQDVEEARANAAMEAVGETGEGAALFNGKIAARTDATWTLTLDQFPEYTGFNWDYYPYPRVEKDADIRMPIIWDPIAVSTACEYPEIAYDFIKWITFSDEGIKARIEAVKYIAEHGDEMKEKYPGLSEDHYLYNITYTSLPITKNPELIDAWIELNNTKPGVKYMVEHMSDGILDGYKLVPGYNDAYNELISKTIKEEVLTGQKTVADVADELMEKANQITKDAYASIGY